MIRQSPVRKIAELGVATVMVGALFVGTAPGPVSADVVAVEGSAYGYFGNVSLFQGPFNTRGPAPQVTLPATGSAVAITASAPTGSVIYGPAVVFSSGPITVTTQGTTGAGGSVTSTASIQTVNTSQSEIFTASALSSTCTASETGVSGSSTVTDGVLVLQDPNPNVSGETGEQIVNVPASPQPNTTYTGTVANVHDNFKAVFNEQVTNLDGSITVYAYHLYLLGPTAIGDVYAGAVECGVNGTSEPTTSSSSSSTSSSTTSSSTTTTTTTTAPTTTTSVVERGKPTTTTTTPGPVLCSGLQPTIVGTDPKPWAKLPGKVASPLPGDDTLTGTTGDDVIAGLGGNDTINGLGGNDVICGGPGNDTIIGGDGFNFILGEAGNDDISGGAGEYEVLDGGDGNDTIEGGAGYEEIYGGSGDNTLSAGPDGAFFGIFAADLGDNLAVGGPGDDYVYVEDAFNAGDRYEGGDGNDQLGGTLDGGTFLAGAGNDYLERWESGTFDPGPGNDKIQFMDIPGGAFLGGDGNDEVGTLIAGSFYGGEGNDTVNQLKGGTFYGEAGADYLAVGTGGVFLGGEGSDIVSVLQEQGLVCGGAAVDYVNILSAFQEPPGTPSPLAGGTFFGEEEADEVGIFLPGGTFFQDGACPVAYVPPPA